MNGSKKVRFAEELPKKEDIVDEEFPTLDERLSRTCQPYNFISAKSYKNMVVWLSTSVGYRLVVLPKDEAILTDSTYSNGKRTVNIFDLSQRGRDSFEFLDNSLIYESNLNWEKLNNYAAIDSELEKRFHSHKKRIAIPPSPTRYRFTSQIEEVLETFTRWSKLIIANKSFSHIVGTGSDSLKRNEIKWQLPSWLTESQAYKELVSEHGAPTMPNIEASPLLVLPPQSSASSVDLEESFELPFIADISDNTVDFELSFSPDDESTQNFVSGLNVITNEAEILTEVCDMAISEPDLEDDIVISKSLIDDRPLVVYYAGRPATPFYATSQSSIYEPEQSEENSPA